MSPSEIRPLVSQGSRVGPVFCQKDMCAFVKVSTQDKKRAVVNITSMTLVDYADRSEYPEGPLHSDPSLFVPIFCTDCYGTNDADYTEATATIVSSQSDKFLVGVCSVYGVSQGENYPESRKDFIVSNDMAYSGACQPQPGKAVFLHKVKKDIGRVKCYWHVHSRSVDKTYLYCCVACDDTEYTNCILNPEISIAFSLGTVGDNKSGPITEECSLVSVPMRPGCFCTMVTGQHLAQTMTRMGFSTLKDSALDAGIDAKDMAPVVCGPTVTPSDALDESSQGQSITDTVISLRKAVLHQAAEVRALKDLLEAIKVQNTVLTQRLTCPDDPDTLFTMQGANDFTQRTGVKTKLCAGIKPTDEDTNRGVTYPTGDTPSPDHKQMEDKMAVTQTQIDNLIKLLQQQPNLPQPQPALPQHQQYQQSQAQLQALQSFMHLVPALQNITQPQAQHLWNPHQQQTGQGFFRGETMYNPSSSPNLGGKSVQYGTLTEEQRRKIAMEYNKEESERQAVSQKEQEKMIDSIKSSIRDVIVEQQRSSVSQEAASNQSSMDTLQSLARDTPYKRARKQAKDDEHDPGDVSKLMKELRELTKQISKRGNIGSSEESCDLVTMDTEEMATATTSSDNSQQSQPPAHQATMAVMNKQQAGYSVPSGGRGGPNNSTSVADSVADFISAVVTKI